MRWQKFQIVAETLIVGLTLLVSNRHTWVCVREEDLPLFGCVYGTEWGEVTLYLMVVLIAAWVMWRKNIWREFFQLLRPNQLLLGFIVFALLSLFWSVLPMVTLYKVLVLIMSTFVAAYLSLRYRVDQISSILAGFIAATALGSIFFVIALPEIGIMTMAPFEGLWRGVFAHKNYTGSMMALGNLIFLVRLASSYRSRRRFFIVNLFFYLLTLLIIARTDSATGIIIALLLHGLVLVVAIWTRWHHKLSVKHYQIILLSFLVILGVGLLNIDKIFNLLGRNSTFTGRIPVWSYMASSVFAERPLIGFGYGASWYSFDFRMLVGEVSGWESGVVNGHNGFMDTFLHLGIIGVILLGMVIVLAARNAFFHLYSKGTITSALPLFILTYILVTNITISFLLEFETFHWIMLLTILFSSADNSQYPVVKPRLVNANAE